MPIKKKRHFVQIRSALFLCRDSFSQQEHCSFCYIPMLHGSRFKVHKLADDLQSRTYAEYGDDSANAYRTAQQPANEQRRTDHYGLYYADRGIGEPLTQGDEQGIPWAAALPGGHIEILPITHDKQTCNHHNAAQGQAVHFWQGKDAVDEVNIIAHQKGIQNGAVADFFFQQNIDEQDEDTDARMDDAIAEPYVIGNTHGKAIPRSKADICLNGQIDAEGKEEQPEGGFTDLFYHL